VNPSRELICFQVAEWIPGGSLPLGSKGGSNLTQLYYCVPLRINPNRLFSQQTAESNPPIAQSHILKIYF
jgi:hypothetical protein